MLFKDWSDLQHIIGMISGMADVLDMTEEVDLKKLKEGLRDVATRMDEISRKESVKLEDVGAKQYKKPDKKPDKKKSEKPEEKQ